MGILRTGNLRRKRKRNPTQRMEGFIYDHDEVNVFVDIRKDNETVYLLTAPRKYFTKVPIVNGVIVVVRIIGHRKMLIRPMRWTAEDIERGHQRKEELLGLLELLGGDVD